MVATEHSLDTTGVIGPFLASARLLDGQGGVQTVPLAVSPSYLATNDNNQLKWTIVLNRHTQAQLENTLSAAVSEIEGLTVEDATKLLHQRFDAAEPALRDKYNQHGFALSNVQVAIPETGIVANSQPIDETPTERLSYDVQFSHTHTPDIGPDATFHTHDVALGVLLRDPSDNPVALTEDMHTRLDAVIDDFFNGGNDFSNTTLEKATESLYASILETVPELAPENGGAYLHGVSMAIDYDGSLDHPDQTMEFIRTLG